MTVRVLPQTDRVTRQAWGVHHANVRHFKVAMEVRALIWLLLVKGGWSRACDHASVCACMAALTVLEAGIWGW